MPSWPTPPGCISHPEPRPVCVPLHRPHHRPLVLGPPPLVPLPSHPRTGALSVRVSGGGRAPLLAVPHSGGGQRLVPALPLAPCSSRGITVPAHVVDLKPAKWGLTRPKCGCLHPRAGRRALQWHCGGKLTSPPLRARFQLEPNHIIRPHQPGVGCTLNGTRCRRNRRLCYGCHHLRRRRPQQQPVPSAAAEGRHWAQQGGAGLVHGSSCTVQHHPRGWSAAPDSGTRR